MASRVLLINANRCATPDPVFPLGLSHVNAALRRAGHEVRIHVREEQLIRNGLDWPAADRLLRDLLTEFRPEAVGLSLTTPAVPETAFIANGNGKSPHAATQPAGAGD